MGVENTIAKLKAYFDVWHNKDGHSDINDRIRNIEESENNTWITNTKSKINMLLNGYDNSTTIKGLKDSIQTNANDINTINANISNLGKWTVHYHPLEGDFNQLATMDAQRVFGYTNDKFVTTTNGNYGLAIIFIRDVFNYNASSSKKFNQPIKTGEIIKTKYRPRKAIHFTSKTPYTIGIINTDGTIQGRCISPDKDLTNVELNGTAIYLYKA